jgi:hypothetical protein
VTLLDAIRDPALFGPFFRDRDSWHAWEAFLTGLLGLPLTDAQAAIFRQHTGRTRAPSSAAREAWLIVGRRGGKSRIAALVAVFLACFRDYSGILAPGERGTLPVIASDRYQARTVFGYITGLLDGVPMLAQLSPANARPNRRPSVAASSTVTAIAVRTPLDGPSASRPILRLRLEVLNQIAHRLGPTLEAELRQVAGQAVGQGLPFLHHGQQGTLAGVHEARLHQ